jgi:cell division protein FtsA
MPVLKDSSLTNQHDKNNITVGLDIGTTKICALVASVDENTKNLKILGIGISESEGLNRGVVVNIEKTTKAIRSVIEQAEQQSGVKISEVTIGIAGDHIESTLSRGIITISSPTSEISQADVDRLLDESRKINISADRRILHVIPQDFVIDGQDGIIDPIGMSGIRLEANVHIITGLSTAIQNITRCVDRAGLKIKHLVLEPLASARAVLSDEEKEVGVALVDIGGGTTDIAIFCDNIIRHTSVFGVAGNQVTTDLQQGLGITLNNAEKVKREYGHTYLQSILHDEIIMIPGIQGRKPQEISKNLLCQILQPRMQEIFEIVKSEIHHSGYLNRLGAGIVITGGSTLLRGTDELAYEVMGLPVKIGIPSGITYAGLAPEIESPVYATAVGLALWGLNETTTNTLKEETNSNVNKFEQTETRKEEAVRKDGPYKLPPETPPYQNKVYETETISKEKNTSNKTFSKIKDFLKQL